MKTATLLLTLIITLSAKPVARWIHGLGSNCFIESGVKKYFKGFDIECIETGMGYISSFDAQVKSACQKLAKEESVLSAGFTLIGFSQGGLIARAVLQKCDIGKYINKLITFGAPHSGVAIIPFTSPASFMNWSVLKLCFYQLIKNHVGPCGYIRSSRYYDSYKNAHNLIAEINNEFQDNAQYRERIQNLDMLVAVQFLQDQMVQPRNTSVFGYYKDTKYDGLVDMEETELYQQDRIGVKGLQESGKLFRCDIDGDHLQIASEDMISFAVNAAHPDVDPATLAQDQRVQERCVFKA